MGQTIRTASLERENRYFQGTGGISAVNASCGFRPAFLDVQTDAVYLSRYANGQPAPIHLLDGLPDEVVLSRNHQGRVAAVKSSLVSGFVRNESFYTREQAASEVAEGELML